MAQQNASSPITFGFFESVLHALASEILLPIAFCLAIGVPSALLYSIQFGLILAKPKVFNSSFFKLFAARAFSNLVGFVGAFLGQRFGRLGCFLPVYLQLPSICLRLFFFMIVHSFHVDNVSTAILLANRLSAIMFASNYEKYWKRILPFALCAIFLLPLPFTWHIFSYDEYVRIQADNYTYTLDNHPRPDDPSDPLIGSWSTVIFLLVCLLLNLATLLAYRHESAKIKAQKEAGGDNKIETNLTIYAVFTFFAQLLYAILLYLSTIWDQLGLSPELGQLFFLSVYNQYPWVNDLSTVAIPSWLLLWASTLMRKEVLKLIGWHKMPWLKVRATDSQQMQWTDPTVELAKNFAA